jgi:pimeloyl-ACP methyl ester carboxylesterase
MKIIRFKTKAGLLISGSYFQFPSKSEKRIENYHDAVLIHAFPFDSDMFIHNFIKKKFVQDFDKFVVNGKILRIFIPDLPGFGGSDILSSVPKDLLPYVENIKELVDKYQINRFYLGGCSMGGYIALEYFNAHPNGIIGLILIDTKPFADNDEQLENRKNAINLLNTSLRSYPEKVKVEIKMKKLFKDNDQIKTYISNLHSNVISENTRINQPKIATQILELMLKQKSISYVQALRGMAGRRDNFNLIKNANIPFMIIVGENDSITPLDIAKQMDAVAKNSILKVISNAGHLSNLENPKEFNQAFLSWLYMKKS